MPMGQVKLKGSGDKRKRNDTDDLGTLWDGIGISYCKDAKSVTNSAGSMDQNGQAGGSDPRVKVEAYSVATPNAKQRRTSGVPRRTVPNSSPASKGSKGGTTPRNSPGVCKHREGPS